MEVINLGAGDGLPPVDWAEVIEKLDAGSAPAPDAHNSRTTWLATVNEDGSPHVTAVGALWLDGAYWFQTGSGTRKGRGLPPRTWRLPDSCLSLSSPAPSYPPGSFAGVYEALRGRVSRCLLV